MTDAATETPHDGSSVDEGQPTTEGQRDRVTEVVDDQRTGRRDDVEDVEGLLDKDDEADENCNVTKGRRRGIDWKSRHSSDSSGQRDDDDAMTSSESSVTRVIERHDVIETARLSSSNCIVGVSNSDRCGVRKSHSFHSPSPSKVTVTSTQKRYAGAGGGSSDGQPCDELTSIFRRRSRGLNDSSEAEKSLMEFEKRLNDEKRRNLNQSNGIVDEKLSVVLRSRRQRVDSTIEENESETGLGKLVEYEQLIETKRRTSFTKDKSDSVVVDEQLSLVLKARIEKLNVNCSPLGLSQEDKKILKSRRHSGLSPQQSLTSPRRIDVFEADSRKKTSSSPGVSYVCKDESVTPSSHQVVSSARRKRVSPSTSFDSTSYSGASSEVDKNRRALRPMRTPSLRKEKIVESSESTLDPQLAALMKRRQEAIAREESSPDAIAERVSSVIRDKEPPLEKRENTTPRLESVATSQRCNGRPCQHSTLDGKGPRSTDTADVGSISKTARSSVVGKKDVDSFGAIKVISETPVVAATTSHSADRRQLLRNQLPQRQCVQEGFRASPSRQDSSSSSSSASSIQTFSSLSKLGGMETDSCTPGDEHAIISNPLSDQSPSSDRLSSENGCDHEVAAADRLTCGSTRYTDEETSKQSRLLPPPPQPEDASAESVESAADDDAKDDSPLGASRVTQIATADAETLRGSGASSDDDLLTELGGADSSSRRKSKRRSHSDRYTADRKEEISAQLALRRDVADTSSSSDNLPRDSTDSALSRTPKTSASLTDLPSSGRTPIAERMAALQKHGNEDWKRRTAVTNVSPSTGLASTINVNRSTGFRPVSIADRLSHLNDAQAGWKAKVQDKDSKQFTVEGKMGQYIAVDSPVTKASRRAPPKKTTSKESESSDVSEVPSVPSSPRRDVTSPEVELVKNPPSVVKIEIPRIDDEGISIFFESEVRRINNEEKVDVSIDAFDDIFIYSNEILTTTKRIKPRRNKVGTLNPIKHLSQRKDLASEYVEDTSNIQSFLKTKAADSPSAWKVELAPEAREGLASKEDFNKVALRKSESLSHPNKHRPFTDVMLIHVKGRRFCQSRLVAPIPQSINSGDCYVLVTAGCIYLWIGQYSNVIERSKATDLASQIQQKHDMGVKSTADLVTINEEKQSILRGAVKFWMILGASEVCAPNAPGKSEEDELYETLISETNKAYRVVGDNELVEMTECSGQILKHDMLRNREAYVFDFGSEMYVWTGKHVPIERRKQAVELANTLWDKDYDFSEYSVNPLSPLLTEENGGVSVKGDKRPKWTVLGKVSQNMETALFKEKFIDWPDTTRLIKVKEHTKGSRQTLCESFSGSTHYDVSQMINSDETPVSLLLEGSHVGRGDAWIDYEDGLRREFEIITQSVDVWHVSEFSRQPLDGTSLGQFHDEDAYVVCWHYAIMQITHTLGGDQSRQSSTGRSRCAYFFWHGRHCGVGEKGTSALMTVELDKEKGPHVPVEQGKEPPCFIRLFAGNMVVHIGKRDSEPNERWRLYIVRNELPAEAYLWEIPVESENLRSRASFILVDRDQSTLFIWNGAKSTDEIIERAKAMAGQIKERCPAEFGIKSSENIVLMDFKEGSESKEFWEAFGGRSHASYHSLENDKRTYNYTPRLFHVSSSSGSFEVNEVLNPARCPEEEELVSPFPFLQVDIYCVDQPALFIIDNRYELFLWQGWWPSVETDDSENTTTGMAETRFSLTRRCAMQTALDYCNELYRRDPPNAFLVYAGREPKQFTNIFPYWQNDDVVGSLVSTSVSSDGDNLERVADVLARLTEVRTYTWSDLQERPLPEGVDPLRLELYLADDDFEELTHFTRKQFEAMPVWKQKKIKQNYGLF